MLTNLLGRSYKDLLGLEQTPLTGAITGVVYSYEQILAAPNRAIFNEELSRVTFGTIRALDLYNQTHTEEPPDYKYLSQLLICIICTPFLWDHW